MVQGPPGPDPSGKREYVGEREIERNLEAELEHTRQVHEAEAAAAAGSGEAAPKKPGFWQRLFGKK
jgi:hypothetical protein